MASQPMALFAAGGTLVVHQASLGSHQKKRLRAKVGAEISVFSVRDAAQLLVELLPADGLGTKTHQSTA
jgi:hypothetical protein